jgi:predicted SnoaL-like aldol condensation-catalyzing enzyme
MTANRNARAERYGGTVTPVGNSKGIRVDAEFFRAHPEFNGKIDVTVIADGQVLLSAKAKRRPAEDDEDPVMLSFLSFLQKQMAEHPELIEPVERAQLARIRKLVKDIDID